MGLVDVAGAQSRLPGKPQEARACASGGYRCERWIPAIYREPLGHHTRAIRQQVLRVVVVTEPGERAVPDRPTELGVPGVHTACLAHDARHLDPVHDARPLWRPRGARPRVVAGHDLGLITGSLRSERGRGGGREARDPAPQGDPVDGHGMLLSSVGRCLKSFGDCGASGGAGSAGTSRNLPRMTASTPSSTRPKAASSMGCSAGFSAARASSSWRAAAMRETSALFSARAKVVARSASRPAMASVGTPRSARLGSSHSRASVMAAARPAPSAALSAAAGTSAGAGAVGGSGPTGTSRWHAAVSTHTARIRITRISAFLSLFISAVSLYAGTTSFIQSPPKKGTTGRTSCPTHPVSRFAPLEAWAIL